MKLLSALYNVVTGGAGAVSDVVIGTTRLIRGDDDGAVAMSQKLLVDTKKFLQGAIGLGVDLVDVSKAFLDNPIVRGANSGPLVAGQLAIFAMRVTTGVGDPENGDDFKHSADLFADAVETLSEAEPKADRWDGTAAKAYQDKNDENRQRTSDMSAADEQMRMITSTEAAQVAETRNTLTDWSTYLYDFGLATVWLYAIPEGGANAKFALDSAAAATALGVTGYSMYGLVRDSFDNAARIREQIALYQRAADEQEPTGGACDPFPPADPRSPRVPPSRLDPKIPDQAPAPEHPSSHPPAVPSSQVQPAPGPGSTPNTPAPAPTPQAAPASFASIQSAPGPAPVSLPAAPVAWKATAAAAGPAVAVTPAAAAAWQRRAESAPKPMPAAARPTSVTPPQQGPSQAARSAAAPRRRAPVEVEVEAAARRPTTPATNVSV